MTIQANFPAIKPSLLLDFANTKQLDSRITYTRASTASFYNGVSTAMAEQNLVLQSQTLDTTWSVFNTSVTSNTDTAPDGTTTADTVTDSTAANIHILQQAISGLSANTSYTVSCYLKKGTNNYAALTLTQNSGSGVWIAAVFDLNAGTVSQTANGASGTLSASSITSVGNGWYRCVITGTTTSAPNYVWISTVPAASGNTFTSTGVVSYTGTGTTIIAWGAQLEQRSAVSAYTATTTQAITNYIPVLQTAASGVARFDNNPTTGESLGLLIEESRTNLQIYSQDFSNATWTKDNASITLNTIVAPDGTLTGSKLVENSSTSEHRFYATLNGIYTRTVYAKKGEREWIALTTDGGKTYFDLNNGVLGTVASGTTATITPVGNGWYRCRVYDPVTVGFTIINLATGNGGITYAGNGFAGAFIWGAQVEAGAFATSYIPTVASQVTRAADAASMTGTNFSTWFNNSEGTFLFNATTASVANRGLFYASSNTDNRIFSYGSGNALLFSANYNATAQFTISQNPNSLNNISAIAYKANDFAATSNGASVGTDTSGNVPVITQIQIGYLTNSSDQNINGTIKKIAYYPLRLSNTNLVALTS
jgi:hypothetical protein